MLRTVLRSIFNKLRKAKIIMLHHVSEAKNTLSPCIISTETLIAFLEQCDKYLSVDELISLPSNKYDGARVITIDDGLEDLYTVAYPILIERNIPFAAFISADLIDKDGYITTEQLKEMASHPLVTIGSHGASHRCLDELSLTERHYEIFESKSKLEAIIGKSVKYFAYSNGRFTKDTKRMVKKAGYKRALGVRPRVYNLASSFYKYDLPRYNLTNETIKSNI